MPERCRSQDEQHSVGLCSLAAAARAPSWRGLTARVRPRPAGAYPLRQHGQRLRPGSTSSGRRPDQLLDPEGIRLLPASTVLRHEVEQKLPRHRIGHVGWPLCVDDERAGAAAHPLDVGSRAEHGPWHDDVDGPALPGVESIRPRSEEPWSATPVIGATATNHPRHLQPSAKRDQAEHGHHTSIHL